MSDTPKADLLAEELRKLDNDPCIDKLVLRLAAAADPEAEARAIVHEVATQVRKAIEVLSPLAEMYTNWRDTGLSEAEEHANGPERS